ncbi:hypothetical protein BDY17DRAFT_258914, partial [Neohortaea acidophila]
DSATTVAMKLAAPMSSPMARSGLFDLMAAHVEKISGPPFPRARRVTPAKLSLIPIKRAPALKLTEKKSPAHMPMVRNSRAIQRRTTSHALAPASDVQYKRRRYGIRPSSSS